MWGFKLDFAITFVLILFSIKSSNGALRAIYMESKLPPMYGRTVATAFQDQDSFLVLPSHPPAPDPRPPNVILKLNLTTDILEDYMELHPQSSYHNIEFSERNIVMDSEGNFYIIGATNVFLGYRAVVKISPKKGTVDGVSLLPYEVHKSISVRPLNGPDNEILIIESASNFHRVLKFNLRTLSATHVTNLPESINPSTAVVYEGNQTLILGSLVNFYRYHKLQRLDLNNMDNSVTDENLFGGEARNEGYPRAVSDGKHVYIIGGIDLTSEYLTTGILKLNPVTMEKWFLPIQDFPIHENNFFYEAPHPVYVKERNRIYFFGGVSRNETLTTAYLDDIWYINLDDVDEKLN